MISNHDFVPTRQQVVVVDALVGNDYSFCMCRGLSDVGVDVKLVTVANRRPPFPCGFEVLDWAPPKSSGSRLRKLGGYGIYLVRLLTMLMRDRRHTVVHIQFLRRPLADALFYAMVSLLGVPLVFTSHNVEPHEASRLESFALRVVRRRAAAVIAHSAHLQRELLETGDVEPDLIDIIPHGDFDFYRELSSASTGDLRQSLGLGDEAVVVLVFGSIRKYKGIDLILEAFALARHENESLHLIVAGRPATQSMGDDLRTQIERLDLTAHVTFHARFIDNAEVAPYLEAADILALPYRNISHSGVLHLAYSFATPVVVTDVGDFAETVRSHGTGFIAESATPQALARTLLKAGSDRDLLRTMGDQALMVSRRDYTWPKIAMQTADVYRRVLKDEPS